MELIQKAGLEIKNGILGIAGLLREDWAPGLFSLALSLALLGFTFEYLRRTAKYRSALGWMTQLIGESPDRSSFSQSINSIETRAEKQAKTDAQKQVLAAWHGYRETFVIQDEAGEIILRNSVRPALFFNIDDLGFSPGGWRILPGLFVTIGLFLTFLGLISALSAMDLSGDKVTSSLNALLTIASAKFIMSLTGLFCSIIFTIVLRSGSSKIEKAIHRLCATLEKRLIFISLESLAVEQLAATREQREHFRMIGLELVAELGRPFREELPQAISQSITSAMGPVLDKVGQIGADGMGNIVNDLSSQFSKDVSSALSKASDKLIEAGDRIASISDRMDQSSGKVGTEIDSAVMRLTQSVDELRNAMGATADTAAGAFTKGAEHLLSIMNQTLEGIRDNTSDGARALSAAASEIRSAAEGFKLELQSATKISSESAKQQMAEAGVEAADAIGAVGRGVLDAVAKTVAEITDKTEKFASRTAEELLSPIDQIIQKLDGVKSGLQDAGSGMQRLADGVRSGADAAQQASGSFRSSSQELLSAIIPVRAATENIEKSTRQLTVATETISTTVVQSTKATAARVEQAVAAASELLGGEQAALQTTLKEISLVLEKLNQQGSRLDNIDEKLGAAFDEYTNRVSAAVDSLFGHVREMNSALAPALDTLSSIVEQAEQFYPQSKAK